MARPGRVDFHLHSKASNVTDYYASNALSLPESYSEPLDLYRVLKERGMNLVTITDHNSIDGVRELLDAGYEDVFISAEMTATFPEDGANIHVTVANVSEAQFKEIDRLRRNVYEMVDFLDREIDREIVDPRCAKLLYFMTHPLMSTQNRPYGREGALSLSHIEKCLLLFNVIEVRNGTRGRFLNGVTSRMLGSLTPRSIDRMATKHGIAPKGEEPWLKAVVGGSDDHCGINPGRTWTEFDCDGERPSVEDLARAVRRRETRAAGAHGGPVAMAHAIVKLIYDGRHQGQGGASSRPIRLGVAATSLLEFAFDDGRDGTVRRTLRRLTAAYGALGARLTRMTCARRPFERVLLHEAYEMLSDRAFRSRLADADRTDDKIFLIISTMLNRIVTRYVERLRVSARASVVRAVKDLLALCSSNLLVSLPYFLCYAHQSGDRFLVRDVRREFGISESKRLVLVTDTFFDVNGVARTIKRMLVEAERRHIDFTVVTCLSAAEKRIQEADPTVKRWIAARRLKIFESVVEFDLPEYEGQNLRWLPFLELLRYAQEEGFTKMQISTPGPVGLMGLFAAKILQLETSSTYHTCFPEYVENYTRDKSLEALTWKAMILFYQSVDEVVVPSRFIADLLHLRGLRNRKLLVLDRWVDLERFHPRFRTAGFWCERGVADADRVVKYIYVGRIGVEKNLDVLAAAYREVRGRTDRAHLIVIGDGPFRKKLESSLADLPVTFTGFLEGECLSRAIASADVKVFPSTTDTWGNAPLEAQASGLPVIVTDRGGPQELIDDGITGFKVKGNDAAALADAMAALLDGDLRRWMGIRAREFAERNDVREPYTAIFDAETLRKRRRVDQEMNPESSARAVIDGDVDVPSDEFIGGR